MIYIYPILIITCLLIAALTYKGKIKPTKRTLILLWVVMAYDCFAHWIKYLSL